jgi:peptide-methionine (R)-S-oxide reductase
VDNFKEKDEAYWQEKLTPEQYHIVRQKGTERPFTGVYNDHYEEGVYRCVACEQPLFTSKTKFKSGSGWPSFWDVIEQGKVDLVNDHSHGMSRVEVTCSQCGAHLGHVFNDGPAPTGLRYCINSLSLDFEPEESE